MRDLQNRHFFVRPVNIGLGARPAPIVDLKT